MKAASVSHMVSGLTRLCRITKPATPVNATKVNACRVVTSPLGNGRARVLAIAASSRCSIGQLRAAADVARSAIPIVPNSNRCAGGSPGVAKHTDDRGEYDERHDARLP